MSPHAPELHWFLSEWVWFTLIVGLIWLRRHVDVARGRREPVLTEADATGREPLPRLTVLVAAKDEEQNIARCISGLLAQDYPDLQVVVINDRSDDRTGAIIDEFAQRDPRLRAVHIESLPAGWFGKNHAMHTGVRHATGQWLCFSDADCAYDSPLLLQAAVRCAIREKAEFLSVLPRLEANTFWERVVQPVAGAIMVFWFPPKRVNDPASPHAYANGAFMLMPHHAYDRLGGHEPVKSTLNEDIHMARRAKQLGVRLRVLRCDGLYRVRMYTGLRQIWRGWSRIFYGCLGTMPRLCASVGMLAFFSVAPYLTLAGAPLAGAHVGLVAAAALFAILCQQSVLWRFYGMTGSSRAWALAYPLGAAVCLGMTIDSMRRVAGFSTTWRGTRYQGGGG